MIFNKIRINVSLDRTLAELIYCPDASWTRAQCFSQAYKSQWFELVFQRHGIQPILWVSWGLYRQNKPHPALLLDPTGPSRGSGPYAHGQAPVTEEPWVEGMKGKTEVRRENHLFPTATASPSLTLSGRKAAQPSPHPPQLHVSPALPPARLNRAAAVSLGTSLKQTAMFLPAGGLWISSSWPEGPGLSGTEKLCQCQVGSREEVKT